MAFRDSPAARHPNRRAWLLQAACGCGAALAPRPAAWAHGDHAHVPAGEGYVRRRANYSVPDVILRDADDAPVPLRSSLASRPVILDFIFTTCATICPVTSLTFSQLQEALGPEGHAVRLVSISIDPEQDTPAALKQYGARFHAGPGWQMLTGRVQDSVLVQRAFDAYRGDKMNHRPVTFLRMRAGEPWLRLDGFASAEEILREYRRLGAQ